MDMLSGMVKGVDHNRYSWLGLTLAVSCIVWIVGCQPTTVSLSTGEPVTRAAFELDAAKISSNLDQQILRVKADIAVLNREIESHNSQIESGVEDLRHQDEMRAQIVDVIGGAIPGLISGGLNPASLVSTGVSLLALFGGIGAVADNRRKNDVISKIKKVGSDGIDNV